VQHEHAMGITQQHPPTLACYISAHGFGHLAQCVPVLLALRRLMPVRLLIRSDLPFAMLQRRLSNVVGGYPVADLIHVAGTTDIGVRQAHAAAEDWRATIQAVRDFHVTWQARVQHEVTLLQAYKVQAVLSNIAPLGLAAAQCVGIPSIAMCCLDWYEIYRGHLDDDEAAMRQIHHAYSHSTQLLHLLPAMPMSSFPHRVSLPPIVRPREHMALCRADVGCSDDRPLALVMFGGTQQPPFAMPALAAMPDWDFLFPSKPCSDAPNVHGFDADAYSTRDVMALADVIISKPGYGTWTEAWVSATPVIYIARPNFAEYPYLRDWLQQQLPAYCINDDDFQQGRWQAALDAMQGQKKLASCAARAAASQQAAQDAAKIILELLPQ